MRTAALPTFRKLYGRIEVGLKENDTITVVLENNYNTYSFGGKKKLVLSTTSWLSGKNDFLGIAYISIGGVCFFLFTLFTVVYLVKPRVRFAPTEQALGYQEMFKDLGELLCTITGFDSFSLQPNAGAAGEYAGLMVIRAYHLSRGDGRRNVCIIPVSAHGTNPASAAMCGMKIVSVGTDSKGNINIEDVRKAAEAHKNDLSALMVTYPSTHGVYEEGIDEICKIIHDNGGQVYMDGANMNAQETRRSVVFVLE
ncbi:hypothetical protein KSP40_PGU005541 [Platanthera guangdongensis]|uniref:Glycine dehydrogenase (aminomethyl-transferring) n=1 Tax=Platanthera guangdongensis TaxID=2320717 RepID=A0ABR2N1K7_9ASPA